MPAGPAVGVLPRSHFMHRCSTRIARCASLLAIALVGFPGAALSQRSETEHATVSMPKVYPGEYNGDLSKLRLQRRRPRRRLLPATPARPAFDQAPGTGAVGAVAGFTGGTAGADADADPELRRHEQDRRVHRRGMRQRLAAGHQRRRRTQPLHPGGQQLRRDLQQDRHAACLVHRKPAVERQRRDAVQRQFAGRSDRRSTTGWRTAGSSPTSRSRSSA